MIINFFQSLHDNLEINLAIMENILIKILILKNQKHVLLHFLSIKLNHQLYSLTDKSQEISNFIIKK